jgi:hypothetical protein
MKNDKTTAAERIMRSGRTQPLTPVEKAFFGVPDHMCKHGGTVDRVAALKIDPAVANRLRKVLVHDERFNGKHGNDIGYTEFVTRALDALGCED